MLATLKCHIGVSMRVEFGLIIIGTEEMKPSNRMTLLFSTHFAIFISYSFNRQILQCEQRAKHVCCLGFLATTSYTRVP